MWRDFGTAICLMLVLEGILPFLNPRGWQQGIALLARMDAGKLRLLGLASMLAGTLLLFWIRQA